MTNDQRIRELCAQLLRAKNPVVIDIVAEELHEAIERYVLSANQQRPPIDLTLLPAES